MPRSGRRSWLRAGLITRPYRRITLRWLRLLEQAQHQILELTSAKRQDKKRRSSPFPSSQSPQDEAGEILADIDLEAQGIAASGVRVRRFETRP